MAGKTHIYGLTLIEFLVALAIVVVLSGLSFPLFLGLAKKYRVSAAAEELYAFLQYVRTETIKRNTPIYVSFVTGNNWCYGANPNSGCNCTIANNCTLGTRSPGSSTRTSLSTTGMTGNQMFFENTRGAASTSGTVTFTIVGDTPFVTLRINRLGTVSMCSTDVSGYTAC